MNKIKYLIEQANRRAQDKHEEELNERIQREPEVKNAWTSDAKYDIPWFDSTQAPDRIPPMNGHPQEKATLNRIIDHINEVRSQYHFTMTKEPILFLGREQRFAVQSIFVGDGSFHEDDRGEYFQGFHIVWVMDEDFIMLGWN